MSKSSRIDAVSRERLKQERQAKKERKQMARATYKDSQGGRIPAVRLFGEKLVRYGLDFLGRTDCPKCGTPEGLSICRITIGREVGKYAAHCETCRTMRGLRYWFPKGLKGGWSFVFY